MFLIAIFGIMKRNITARLVVYLILAFFGIAAIASCAKEAGHLLSTTTTVKSATMQFYLQGDTTHILATPSDTVSFTSYTTPQTTVTGKNGKKYTSCVIQFSGNAKGTFTLTNLALTVLEKSGTLLTTSSQNYGTATIDSINVNKGYMSGNFTGKVLVAANDTANVVGLFTIQQ